jgi:hypothetical protein
MKKVIVFLPLLFFILTSVYLLTQKTSGDDVVAPKPYTQSEPYSNDVIVSSPSPDATVTGSFAIKGKVAHAENIRSVKITVTSLSDKTQEPLKIYQAVYNPKTAQWQASVPQGDLSDNAYALYIEVTDGNGNQQSTYSSVIIDSSTSQGADSTPQSTI